MRSSVSKTVHVEALSCANSSVEELNIDKPTVGRFQLRWLAQL